MNDPTVPAPRPRNLPTWADDLVVQYESGATSQFICHGNVEDRILLPLAKGAELGSLTEFLAKVLLPRFDVVLSYDLAAGLRVERGGETFTQWPRFKEQPQMPRGPREAVELLSHYFRYCVNLGRLGQKAPQVGLIVRNADLVLPNQPGAGYDLNALACQVRDWASDPALAEHHLATFLITANLADLHPLLVTNPRAARARVPLPDAAEMRAALEVLAKRYPRATRSFPDLAVPAAALAGAALGSVEATLKSRHHLDQPLTDADLVGTKKALVENECSGLIEFIDAKRTLNDLHGQEAIKTWIRQDIALWKAGDLQALPMGYLLCGPVGTGKTYLVECIAGEAGVPVVKLKNFRDKWVGSTEGNLEKIFRLVHALGRAVVFVDEADQALGRRDAGSNDSGIGGRIYAMMAEEMSNTRNRGKVLWILASSRPDLIEVDLKRPGRVDVKIPIFPTTTPEEGFGLLRALCKRRGVEIAESEFADLRPLIPDLLTPGAAEALAVKTYRLSRTSALTPVAALRDCLTGYQHPVPRETMDFQIGLAVAEATDRAFVPAALRARFP